MAKCTRAALCGSRHSEPLTIVTLKGVMERFPRRLGIFIAAAAALLLVYSAAGFLLFPSVLKSVAAQKLSSFLGRTVTIRAIDFNPYALSITIQGLQIAEPTGESDSHRGRLAHILRARVLPCSSHVGVQGRRLCARHP